MGNIKLIYTKSTTGNIEIVEKYNYYAFGMKRAGYNNAVTGLGNATAQKLEYNGKEYQDDFAFNMYDYGWRNYDAAIGRWHNIDPLAEISRRWSPYNYCYNNPVVFIDPNGRKATYNWGTGQYMDGGKVVSFDSAMASNGVKFTPVDSAIGALIYEVGATAYDAMVGTSGGGGPGDGDKGPGFLRRTWNWLFGEKKQEVEIIAGPVEESNWGVLKTLGNFCIDSQLILYPSITLYEQLSGEEAVPRFEINENEQTHALATTAVIAVADPSPVGEAKLVKHGVSNFDDLVKIAQQLYPKKAGRIEWHHIDPEYFGGPSNGTLAPLDGAYHQLITNAFRAIHPYGSVS